MNRELAGSSFELRIHAQGSRRLGRIHSVYGSIIAHVPPKRIALLSVRKNTAPPRRTRVTSFQGVGRT